MAKVRLQAEKQTTVKIQQQNKIVEVSFFVKIQQQLKRQKLFWTEAHRAKKFYERKIETKGYPFWLLFSQNRIESASQLSHGRYSFGCRQFESVVSMLSISVADFILVTCK